MKYSGVLFTNTLGVRVDVADSLGDYIREIPIGSRSRAGPFIATFVNPYSVIKIRDDNRFLGVFDRFDIVMPDGIGMCIAVRHLHQRRAARASFDSTSLAPVVFAAACRYGSTIGLVGGAPGVAARAADRLRAQFPGIRIVATYDGYEQCQMALSAAPVLEADIVVCGMGFGQQEEFLVSLQERGWKGCGFTCGGYLDQLVQGFTYYPKWIDDLHLRWAYRLFREPRRLWRRYLVDYAKFAVLLLTGLATSRLSQRRPHTAMMHGNAGDRGLTKGKYIHTADSRLPPSQDIKTEARNSP